MSQRYAQCGKQDSNTNNSKYIPKYQKKFLPKHQSATTLSNSLRQSSKTSGGTSSTSRYGITGTKAAAAVQSGNFVNYLPQDEAVAAGFSANEGGLDPVESQRVVDLLNRELSRLLKLKPRDFWREVASDASLHAFLDSFLKFRSRWYDFPHRGAKGIVAGVIVGEHELSRRVFMLLYRISSNKDPGARSADSLSSKDHTVILQEKKLLDLPKLLDICAIYGHENEDLTRLLVENALKAQPGIYYELTGVLSHFLGIVHTMHQRSSSSLEALLSSRSREDLGSSRLCDDLLEVMDFINDAIISMDAFVNSYRPAAVFFSSPVEMSYGNEELLTTLARLHDSLIPSFQRGLRIIFAAGEDDIISNVAVSLKMLSMRIINFGWKLLDLCYLSDEVFDDDTPVPPTAKMFPAKVEDPFIRADILVQTFREINAIALHEGNHVNNTFLKHAEKNYNLISRLEKLQSTGWLSMDEQQLQYLCGVMMDSSKAVAKEQPSVQASVTSNKVHTDEDAAIIESKISQVRDLFPDYGKGFLAACLEVYNHNPEEVIQRILEDTLHDDLRSLDRSLDTMTVAKSSMALGRNDKGKGKLVESSRTADGPPIVARKQQTDNPAVSSSTTVGRYVRKSKADFPDNQTLDSRDEKDAARTSALIAQYEYDDEYDDSFDDLGQSFVDSRMEENEIMGDRINRDVSKSWATETEKSSQDAPSSKWGSRKKPQYFVKDGKNYSYKVAGSVAVANADEASLINEVQGELIHGLGRGGNHPLGAVKKLMELEENDKPSVGSQMEGSGNTRNTWGRGRRGGRNRESNEGQDNQSDDTGAVGRGNMGSHRGGGGRGRGRGQFRKNRAMNKHFAGLGGF